MLLNDQKRKLQKALKHLAFSHTRVEHLPSEPDALSEDQLADWEAYSARFSRVVEIFLGRYLRSRVLQEDPAFEGTLRDFVNQGEKLGIIDDVSKWMELRGLRNITAHEYSETDLKIYFDKIRHEYATLTQIKP